MKSIWRLIKISIEKSKNKITQVHNRKTDVHRRDKRMTAWFISVIVCGIIGYPTASARAAQNVSDQEPYAYTSDMRVFIGGYGYYGAVTIDGEYYIPLSLFGEQGYALYPGFTWFMTENGYQIVYDEAAFPPAGQRRQISYQYRTKAGILVGKAIPSKKPLLIKTMVSDPKSDFSEKWDTIENGICLLGGIMPYVKASALASVTNMRIYEEKKTMYLFYEEGVRTKRVYEEDLVGLLLKELDDGNDDFEYWIAKITSGLEHLSKSDDMIKSYSVLCNKMIQAAEWSEESYASVFQVMCLRVGIPCDIVQGMREEEWHTWNRVWIGDEWLYIDGEDYLLSAESFAKNHWWPDEDCTKDMEQEKEES